MEGDKEKPAGMKPLLLKIAIPLALSFAGLIISTLTGQRRRRKPSFDSLDLMDSYESGEEDRSLNLEEEEEEEREGEAVRRILPLESSRGISLRQCHDGSNWEEEIGGMKLAVAGLEDRRRELESQFYSYSDMKEQESAFQKLQIMCLGLKLESLESENQRLAGAVEEFQGRTEQLDLMSEEIASLSRKVKKLSRANRAHSRVIHQQAVELRAKEEEILGCRGELKWATELIKEVADELQQEKKAREEKTERKEPSVVASTSKSKEVMVIKEDVEMTRFDNKIWLDQLQQLRDQWSAEMEELIYLGWINACLRHELQMDQEEEEKEVKPVRGLVVELPVAEQVTYCSVEFVDSDSPAVAADHGETQMDVAAPDDNEISRKPRFISKLKGWARGKKGRCRRAFEGGQSPERWPASIGS